MSNDPEEPANPKSRNYRNPPAEHRFKKGQSGNPKGRPRKDRDPVHSVLAMVEGKALFAAEDSISAAFRREANRVYRARQGDRFVNMSGFDLMVRQYFNAAMKGDISAQRYFFRSMQAAESRRNAAKAHAFSNALELQRRNRDLLERAERNGLPAPDVVPHPDDFRFNPDTLDVEYFGPVTKEDRDYLDNLHDERPFIEEDLRKAEECVAANPRDKKARESKKRLSTFCAHIKADEPHWRVRQVRKHASFHIDGKI